MTGLTRSSLTPKLRQLSQLRSLRQSAPKQTWSRCFTASTSEDSAIFPLSSTSLGLENAFILPHLASIRQLPEVSTAIEMTHGSDILLKRALDVFASFQEGGSEHRATLALLAECMQREGQDARWALSQLFEISGNADAGLALAKAHWLHGDFESAQSLCENLLDGPLSTIQEASARTGQAINRLLLVKSLDDAYSVRDPFRMVVKSLESTPSYGLALAQLNFGNAEAIYADIVARERQVEVPLDGAMRSWKQSMTTLKRISSHKDNMMLARAIKVRLTSNMAWGLLQMQGDNVKEASEYASKALKMYDRDGMDFREGFGRTLALVARCYHKSSSAVTAEGLFQSALDEKLPSPLAKLELRDTYKAYSALCSDWERREKDADRLSKEAAAIDESLPGDWPGKSSLFGSMWFWTPSVVE